MCDFKNYIYVCIKISHDRLRINNTYNLNLRYFTILCITISSNKHLL